MKTERLVELLSSMRALPVEFVEALENAVKRVSYPKGHYLVQAQTPAHHAYFLEKGFALAFQYASSRRVVTDLWREGEIVLSPKSFFEQVPGDAIIQLCTNSELLSISHTAFEQLARKFQVANFLACDVAADYYAKCQERMVDINTLDTWQRYLKLMSLYPGIELSVSQDMIASYLGVTPQSLSRLKAQNYRKE